MLQDNKFLFAYSFKGLSSLFERERNIRDRGQSRWRGSTVSLGRGEAFLQSEFYVFARKVEIIFRCKGIWQKQAPRGVLRKKCSENMQQSYRRTLVCQHVISIKCQKNFILNHT